MRVAVVTSRYPPEVQGGAEVFTNSLNAELGGLGIDVEVFTSSRLRNRTEKQGRVTVHYYRSQPPAYRLTADLWGYNTNPWARGLVSALGKCDYDLLHVHSINQTIMLTPLLGAMRKPAICHVHDSWPICYRGILYDPRAGEPCQSVSPSCCFGPGRRFLGRFNLALRSKLLRQFEEGVDVFIAPSRFMGDALTHRGFTTPGKVRLVRLGIALPSRVVPSGDRRRTFVFAGRLVSYKNPQLIVELAATGRVPEGYQLLIFGRGPMERDLAHRIRRVRAAQRKAIPGGTGTLQTSQAKAVLQQFGQVPNARLLDEVGHATGLLVPSLAAENSPVVIYEALAHGTPVISTDAGGARELVEASGAGRVVAPTDPAAWEEAIQALSDPETHRRFSESALLYARRHLGIRDCAKSVLTLYDELGA